MRTLWFHHTLSQSPTPGKTVGSVGTVALLGVLFLGSRAGLRAQAAEDACPV